VSLSILLLIRRRRRRRRRGRRIRLSSSGRIARGGSSVLRLPRGILRGIGSAVGGVGGSGSRVRSGARGRRGFGRGGRGFSARGFLLRAGCEHQRRDKSAKSKFCVHRSIPREARVRGARSNKLSAMRIRTAGAGFYRVVARLETAVGCQRQRAARHPVRRISTNARGARRPGMLKRRKITTEVAAMRWLQEAA
jgi:hypothetical protein